MTCMFGVCIRPAELYPALTVNAKSGPVNTKLILNLPVCEECSTRVQLADILREPGWMQIESAFRAKGAECDRSSARVEFLKIGSSEVRDLQRALAIKRGLPMN